MKQPAKMLWYEGLELSPRQFQRQDQYHEARLQRVTSAALPHLWGVHALEWDPDALRNQVLRATSMGIIFQDGELYDAPDGDALPAPFQLDALPGNEQMFTFHIAIPVLKDHGCNYSSADEPAARTRYWRHVRDTPDLFDGEANEVKLDFLHKTAQFLAPHESREGYLSFPVVRLG